MWRGVLQTLLVGMLFDGVMGLLPGHDDWIPGRRSLRLACPGLYYVAPLGLKKTEGEGSAMRQAVEVWSVLKACIME